MPEETQQKAAAPAAGNAGTGAPKKSNACMIIVIILLVLLVLGGVGGYLAYRYVKNKVNNVVDTAKTSTSSSSSTTTTTDSTSSDQEVKNNYNNTAAVTATSVSGKTYSTEIAGILSPIFGGAKLSEWMDLNGSDSMTFLVPRKVTAADFASIENGFVAKGYSKNANYTTSTDMSIYFDNATVEILTGTTVGESTVRATVAPKTQ